MIDDQIPNMVSAAPTAVPHRPMGALKKVLVDTRVAFANFSMRVPSTRYRHLVARTLMRWTLGESVTVGRYGWIADLGGVRVGSVVNIGHHAHLDGRGGLTIGSRVDIAPYAMVLTAEHDPHSADHAGRHRPVMIGDRVWLATGATILPGTVVGDGVVVAARAVARGVLEANGIYAGNPARLIGHRDRAAQSELRPYSRYWM